MSRTAPSHMPPPRPNKAKHPPSGAISAFFWRKWVCVEGTFVFSMLEPWETALILGIFFISMVLLGVAVAQYLPQHVVLMVKRAIYYILGAEGEHQLASQWFGTAPTYDPVLKVEL